MLGKVESKQPVQGIPTATIVLSQSSLSWSEDNNIALASQLGLYIFVLHLSPNGDHPGILLFDRFFVSAPDHSNPYILSGPPLVELIKGLERTEAHAVMLDATLSSAQRSSNELALHKGHISQGMGADSSHNGFRLGSWSPMGLSHRGCLICLVTYDHQISIVGQNGMQWVTLSDLTPIWHKYLTIDQRAILNNFQKIIGNRKHHKFIAETKLCGVADFAWSPLISDSDGDNSFCYILMATLSMHLVVWKIPYFNGSLHPCIVDISSLENCKDRITNIHLFSVTSESEYQGYLFIGTVTGDIHLYFTSIANETFYVSYITTLPNPTPRMSARHMKLLPLEDDDFYVLFCSKNSIFFGFLLNLTPSSCQVGATTFAHTGCLNISGINVTTPNIVYVSSKDGNLKEFTIEIDIEALSIYISKKELILASDNVTYDGFSTSPHKSFWAILETVSASYDHLILREPSIVNIFQINKLETISASLLNNCNVPVAKHIDLFESIRLLYRPEYTNLLLPKQEEISKLSSTNKTTYLWFTDIILSSRESLGNENERENIEKIRSILVDNILKDHICQVLSNLSQETFPTNPLRKHSLFLMCTFLQQIKGTHPSLKSVLTQLKNSGEIGEEKCIVCEKNLKFQSVIFAKCSSGHTIPRCLRTLLPTLPVLKCRHCCSFYLPEAENWFKDGDKCVICCSKLHYKSRERRIENISAGTSSKAAATTLKSAASTPKSAATKPKSAATTPKPAATTPKSAATTPKSAATTPKAVATTTPKPVAATTTPKAATTTKAAAATTTTKAAAATTTTKAAAATTTTKAAAATTKAAATTTKAAATTKATSKTSKTETKSKVATMKTLPRSKVVKRNRPKPYSRKNK